MTNPEAANDNTRISHEEYHGGPGISASGLIQISRSPAHYRYWKDHPAEPTPAMLRGSAIHAAILEPEIFEQEFVALDDKNVCAKIGGAKPRATKAYKEWLAEWQLAHAGAKIIGLEDFDAALRIADKARAHPVIAAMLDNESAVVEGSLFWTDEETGVLLKARPDLRLLSGRLIDVKTCQDARPDAFARSIYQHGYFLQATTYQEALRVVCQQPNVPFRFIAIEAEPPYGIAVYDLDRASLEIGFYEFRRCLELYAWCEANQSWPDYSQEPQPISLPAWAMRG